MKSVPGKKVGIYVVALLVFGVWMFNTVTAEPTRICVCHVENEKSGAGHVLEVDENSLQGHLNHGDKRCDDCSNKGKDCNISTEGACTEATKDEEQTQTQEN